MCHLRYYQFRNTHLVPHTERRIREMDERVWEKNTFIQTSNFLLNYCGSSPDNLYSEGEVGMVHTHNYNLYSEGEVGTVHTHNYNLYSEGEVGMVHTHNYKRVLVS